MKPIANFVADAPTVIGFDPYLDLAELIVARAGLSGRSASAA